MNPRIKVNLIDFDLRRRETGNEDSHSALCRKLITGRNGPLIGHPSVCDVQELLCPSRIRPTFLRSRLSHAAEHSDIVVCPWSLPGDFFDWKSVVRAMNAGRNGLGTIWLASIGNDPRKPIGFPARLDACIGIGVFDRANGRAMHQSTGKGLDVLVPLDGWPQGVDADLEPSLNDSTVPQASPQLEFSSQNWRRLGGTSAAAAVAGGAAAHLLNVHPQCSADVLRSVLRNDAADVATNDSKALQPSKNQAIQKNFSPFDHTVGVFNFRRAIRLAKHMAQKATLP